MTSSTKTAYGNEREAMADQMRAIVSSGMPEVSEEVLAVMQVIPRHFFIPEHNAADAYSDSPQLIGYGQTISQPYVVALMTTLASITPGSRVLEVGTGSGYQAAVLASLTGNVFSIETIPELATAARANLQRAGVDGVNIITGDGHSGLAEQAPFDAIVVTAAAKYVPPALTEQLAPGGRLVIPLGMSKQVLTIIKKDAANVLLHRRIIPVRFVPLVRARRSSHAQGE